MQGRGRAGSDRGKHMHTNASRSSSLRKSKSLLEGKEVDHNLETIKRCSRGTMVTDDGPTSETATNLGGVSYLAVVTSRRQWAFSPGPGVPGRGINAGCNRTAWGQ